MKNKIIFSFSILVLMGSCTDLHNDLFDGIPALIFPENEIQAAVETIPVYEQMRDFIDWGGWWFCQELTSDEMVGPTRHTDWDDGGKWRVLHQHKWTNTTEAINSMWSRYYIGIGEANRLIEKYTPAAGSPAADKAIAKLMIMRAFYYYLLIDNYGDVPYVTSYSKAPEFPEKANKSDIYNGIVADIENSIPFLDNVSISRSAVSKGMAFSLLAKLYLNAEVYTGTEEWEATEAACDSVIDLGIYSLESDPLGPFTVDNETSPENIFTIPYDEDAYTGFNLHMRTLHYISNQTFDMTAGPWNGFAVMEAHYDTYEADDSRKINGFLIGQQYSSTGAKLFDETAGSYLIFDKHIPALLMDATLSFEEIRMSGARVVKFEVANGAKADLSNDFPLFRYADILLMKAEAIIRQAGHSAEADALVNQIRSRADVGNMTDVTLDMLLAERGREMFYEGHRRQDLIRYGKFNDSWWEKNASSSDRNTFPIPQWVLDANPNL